MATIKQRVAVQKLAEILKKSKGKKNITWGKLLRDAGYSEESSRKPFQVTRSKTFRELIEEAVPDSKMAERFGMLTDAVTLDQYKLNASMTDKEINELVESIPGFKVRRIQRNLLDKFVTVYFWRPDNMSIDKALDKLVKIKGYYAPEKSETKITGIKVVNYGDKKV